MAAIVFFWKKELPTGLHTTNSYYNSSHMLFFTSLKVKPNKGIND
jgi:hypothetical protein